MNFELFSEEMRRLLESWIGKDYQVQVQKIMKNNACSLTGLVIHKIGENVQLVIYLEPYYEKFKEAVWNCLQKSCLRIIRSMEQSGYLMIL